jgi:hypothetical protein
LLIIVTAWKHFDNKPSFTSPLFKVGSKMMNPMKRKTKIIPPSLDLGFLMFSSIANTVEGR